MNEASFKANEEESTEAEQSGERCIVVRVDLATFEQVEQFRAMMYRTRVQRAHLEGRPGSLVRKVTRQDAAAELLRRALAESARDRHGPPGRPGRGKRRQGLLFPR